MDWGVVAEFVPSPADGSDDDEDDEDDDDDDDDDDDGGRSRGRTRYEPVLSATSDRLELLDVVRSLSRAVSSSAERADVDDVVPFLKPDLSYVRCVDLGPNCVAVSWGLDDGLTVLYRRRRRIRAGGEAKGEKSGPFCEWEPVATVGPGQAVVEAAAGSISIPRRRTTRPPEGAEEENDGYGYDRDYGTSGGWLWWLLWGWWWGWWRSGNPRRRRRGEGDGFDPRPRLGPYELGSLRVTDLVPMAVRGPPPSSSSGIVGTTTGTPATTTTPTAAVLLAISRLGGYVEIIGLPPDLCLGPPAYGPSVPGEDDTGPRRSRRRRRGGDGGGEATVRHYAEGLPDLSRPPSRRGLPHVALSTSSYHSDALCLSAHRTNVGHDAVWDEAMRPEGPPAEFVLASCGSRSAVVVASEGGAEGGEGGECITLWGVTAVFDAPPGDDHYADVDDDGNGNDGNGNEGGGPPNALNLSIHVGYLGHVDVPHAGPDVTVFAV